MIVYLMLTISILMASSSILLVFLAAREPLSAAWAGYLQAVALAIFVYLYGTWIYLSVYTKYAFGIAFLVALAAGIYQGSKQPESKQRKRWLLRLFFSAILITASVLYFTGTTGKAEKAALSFPLKRDQYFILQGGKGLPANFFHYSYRGAVYAIDIVQLDKWGRRSGKIFSSRLNDYHIFNDTVYSPCSGVIRQARDENPDNIPPDRTRGPSNTNSVLIEADSFYVFMAHLKYKGVFVQTGEQVRPGQPVGLVGNSGFTLEPHLHIQAHKRTGKDAWYREEPLLIEFDGRSYLLFEVIRPKKVRMVED